VSNPDSREPYWQEPVGAGRRAARDGSGREDPYGGAGGHGRPAGDGRPDGNGRSNGSRAGSGRAADYDRPPGNDAPGGSRRGGYDGDGYGPGRSGSRGFAPRGSRPRGSEHSAGRGGYGPDDGYGAAGGRRAFRGSQAGRDLRARLGLGNGARDVTDARDGAGDGGGRGTRGGSRFAASGLGAFRRGTRADTQLRARLGLRGGPGPAPGGAGGYGDDTVGYRGPVGPRTATALRERGTSRFTGTERIPGRPGAPGDGGSGDDWDGGPRRRRKGSWWRHWTWRKALAVVAAGFGFIFLLFAAAVVYEYQHTQIPTAVSELALQQSSTVYFSDGKTQVGTFSANGIDRQILTSSQIPTVMKDAIVAAEDRNFYHEGGISITGIMRSAYHDLFSNGGLQGGSTLTEEFAKNYYTTIGTSRSVSTKIKEIFVSIKLSHQKSKDWIMTQYLNTVPFGNNAYGVAAAAQIYFNEPALKLTVSQAAMLAALVNEPSLFSADPHAGEGYTALVSRWHYVLTNMVRDGAITQQQADAQTFPKVSTVNYLAASWTGFKGYIMSAVLSELQHKYPAEYARVDTGGLKIVTTISLQKMRALYAAVNENLAAMRADGTPLPWYAHVGAVLEQPGTGDILAFYGGPNYGLNATNPRLCARIFCQLNMAMENREQVGSSFKPYVLSTAVSEGMNVSNSVLNGIEPMCVPPDSTLQSRMELSLQTTNCPLTFFPVNIQGENSGHGLSVQNAAAISSDPAFEDLVHRAGTQATINMAQAFGVNTGDFPNGSGLQAKHGEVGMALGIASLTVEEQATTFATLANGGMYVTPHVISQIVDNGSLVPLNITHRQVLTAAEAADVDFALSADTQPGGTAYPNGVLSPQRPTIGKTGTTDNAQSAFFLGAIPQYSLAVGIFTNHQNGLANDSQSLNGLASVNGQGRGFGGNWPTTIWSTFMNKEFSGLPIEQLPTPNFTCCTSSGAPFIKWNQVPKQPPKHKKHHDQNPNPNPNPNPSASCKHHRLGCPPLPSTGPSPNPNPTVPNPSPTTPNPTTSGLPTGGPAFGTNVLAAALLPAAEDPAATSVRRPGGG
jgi:membrane peptidoglycan carboxypeptidase